MRGDAALMIRGCSTYVYDLALRWELDHMMGNRMRPMHDDEKRSLHMRSEGQLPN